MQSEWDALVKRMRERLPIKRRLIIRRCKMRHENCGNTTLSGDEKTIQITVNSSLPWQTQVDSFLHEYPHALEYDKYGAHSDRWGKFHAQVYSVWVEATTEA
jgi:hypothetical protein